MALHILKDNLVTVLKNVGWVEERNPTVIWFCWVALSFNPTYESVLCSQSPSPPVLQVS